MAKKQCTMCESLISGSHYTVSLKSNHDSSTEEYIICNTCASSLRLMLTGVADPNKGTEPQLVMKSDNTLLTATGYIRVIREVLDGTSLVEVSRKYSIPIDVLRDQLVPVYARMFDKPYMTDKELLAIRPVMMKKSMVREFKFSDGKKKNAEQALKLYLLGTWSADEICANVRWTKKQFEEFIAYYSRTSYGYRKTRKHITRFLDNSYSTSVEWMATYMALPVEFILDIVAGIDMSMVENVDPSKHKTVKQLYQLGKDTMNIAGSVGMPYRTVLAIINRFRHPNLREIK